MKHLENAIFTNICLIYDDEGNILVQDRKKKTWPGLTLPGGHVEKNESFVESVIREIKEETNLDISNVKLCGITQWTPLYDSRYIVVMFKTNCFSGELKDSDEGHLFWIKPEDLDKYTLSADLKEMIEVMMNDNLSEFISLRDENDKELSKKLL